MSVDTLTLGLDERSYTIYFGKDILAETGSLCRSFGLGKVAAVVTNPTVGALYFAPVAHSLESAGFRVTRVEIPDGEEFKNIETLNGIYGALIAAGLNRDSFIVALGGGVVGDIAGFAAASYLRGIPFVQVPTTLLAQVDSSVGGKTGINHTKGKNLIGAFYQPRGVVIDVETLSTLPEREFLGGLAEVVKYGVVLDADLFATLERSADRLLARDRECLLAVTKRCCAIKASVVEKDERESGLRAVLNYGHTLGHAVETLTGYTTYTHGEAVAIGMAQAAKIAESMGLAEHADTERVIALLQDLGLPVELPRFDRSAYIDAVLRDKKARDGGVSFVLNRGVGDFSITNVTDLSTVLRTCGVGG